MRWVQTKSELSSTLLKGNTFQRILARTGGVLNTEINGLHIVGKIETEVGNWGVLFQNIYEVIAEGKKSLIKQDEIVAQLRIIELVESAAG